MCQWGHSGRRSDPRPSGAGCRVPECVAVGGLWAPPAAGTRAGGHGGWSLGCGRIGPWGPAPWACRGRGQGVWWRSGAGPAVWSGISCGCPDSFKGSGRHHEQPCVLVLTVGPLQWRLVSGWGHTGAQLEGWLQVRPVVQASDRRLSRQIWAPGSSRGPGPWCALLWAPSLPRGVHMVMEASDGGSVWEGRGGPWVST